MTRPLDIASSSSLPLPHPLSLSLSCCITCECCHLHSGRSQEADGGYLVIGGSREAGTFRDRSPWSCVVYRVIRGEGSEVDDELPETLLQVNYMRCLPLLFLSCFSSFPLPLKSTLLSCWHCKWSILKQTHHQLTQST